LKLQFGNVEYSVYSCFPQKTLQFEPFLFIIALEGYCEVPVSFKIHAMNLKRFLRDSLIDVTSKV
jgi:hypothetical protein